MSQRNSDQHNGVEVGVSATAASSRAKLSKERVVTAAIACIDADGLAGFSMRRLGRVLSVKAMSLYRYTPGKEELFNAVGHSLLADMRSPDPVRTAPLDGWRDFLLYTAHAVRGVALAHPSTFLLVTSRPLEASWLRPPLRSCEWVEELLTRLVRAGFTDADAVVGYRAFTCFLLGHLVLEVSTQRVAASKEWAHESGTLNEFPTVRRLQAGMSADHGAVEFADALDGLLDKLQRMLENADA